MATQETATSSRRVPRGDMAVCGVTREVKLCGGRVCYVVRVLYVKYMLFTIKACK